jgi:shikimate kinase
MLPTRIYLTGFMGSGKSTIGPELARALGYDFLDLDQLIEQRAGKPIPVIFSEEGEPAFRNREADVLREVAQRENTVVALGGGALTLEENLRVARSSGLVVYLRVPAEHLARRLRGRTGRPLIMGNEGSALSDEDLRRRVALMIGAREPFYSQAHVTVDAGGMSSGETVDVVLREVRAYGVGTYPAN